MARPFQKEQELFRLIIMHNKLMTAEDLEYFYQDTPDPEEAIARIVSMGHFDEKTASKLLKLYKANLSKIQQKNEAEQSPQETEEESADTDESEAYGEDPDDLSPEEEARLLGEAASERETQERTQPREVGKAELPPEPKQASPPPSPTQSGDEDHGIPVPGFQLDFKPKASAYTPEPPVEDQVIGPKLKIGDGGQRFLLNLIKLARRLEATDLYIKANAPAWIRVNGQLKRLNMVALPADIAEKAMLSLLLQKQLNEFKKQRSISTYYAAKGEVGRIRLEIWRQYHGTECVIRLHQSEVKAIEQVAGPDLIELAKEIPEQRSGLFITAGRKSSGKTVASYALLSHLLAKQAWRGLSIEKPVEQVVDVDPWQITQRDMGLHIKQPDGLLRMLKTQRFDVLFMGVLSSDADIELALSASESGIRVIATMPQLNAVACASRIVRAQVLSGVHPDIAIKRTISELNAVTTLMRVITQDQSVQIISQTVYPSISNDSVKSLEMLTKDLHDQEMSLGANALSGQLSALQASMI